MQQIFNRIHAQLARLKEQYQSDTDFSFNDGASDEDFEKLEKALGFELPDGFKEVYRIHDGSDNWFVLMGDDWLSIEEIIEDYQSWKRLYDEQVFSDEDGIDFGCEPENDKIKSDYWVNPKWVPFTRNACGDNKMIDLDPSDTGTKGQIIQLWHDDASRELLAVSLKAFFEQYATDLENDVYVIDTNYGLIKKSDLAELEKLSMLNDE